MCNLIKVRNNLVEKCIITTYILYIYIQIRNQYFLILFVIKISGITLICYCIYKVRFKLSWIIKQFVQINTIWYVYLYLYIVYCIFKHYGVFVIYLFFGLRIRFDKPTTIVKIFSNRIYRFFRRRYNNVCNHLMVWLLKLAYSFFYACQVSRQNLLSTCKINVNWYVIFNFSYPEFLIIVFSSEISFI